MDALDRVRQQSFLIAAEHVSLQHVVWDGTEIPAKALLDIIEKNIRAFAANIADENA
jgi:hypothetical protein